MAGTGRLAAALILLAWCTAASALSLDSKLRDLRLTTWSPRDGVPTGISTLVQASDGYLWIASTNGLHRFDGLRFEPVEIPRDDRLSSIAIFELFAPSSGGVWIGFSFGGAAFLKDGQATIYTEREGLPPGSVMSFTEDHDGRIWMGGTGGVARLEGSRWLRLGPESGHPNELTDPVMVDSAGTLWSATRKSVRFLPKGETMFREVGAPGDHETGAAGTTALFESRSGAVWWGNGAVVRKVFQNDTPRQRTRSPQRSLLFDRDGAVWVTSEKGEVRRNTRPEGLDPRSANRVESWDSIKPAVAFNIFEDSEGNVWVASERGLLRFSERTVAAVVPPPPVLEAGYAPINAAIVAADRGALWVGGWMFPSFKVQDRPELLPANVGSVSCAIRLDDGSVLLGGPNGFVRFAPGRVDRMKRPEGTGDWDVQAMAKDRAGALWVSIVRNGVFRLKDGAWKAYGGIASLPELTAISMATDAEGRVWFGYTEGRVAVVEGDRARVFAGKDRLPIGNVTAIHARRGRVWAGGDVGLALFDGTRFRAMSSEVEGAFRNITGIIETADGDLWLNAAPGIIHITSAELRLAATEPAHRIRGEIFDAADGVQGTSARIRPLPSAVEGTDGRLWFATGVDIYSLDPTRIHRNLVPPQVSIQALVADGKSYALTEKATLPANPASIRIDYVGISLTMAEKVRYRYKLEGVDKDWQDVRGRQQAFYTNLAPGLHRFHVMASNNDGVWNETGGTLEFRIPPTFFQTGWFIALCVAASGLALWAVIRFRVRQVARQMRTRFNERMAERERIARELHDTLLQGTQGLVYSVQAAANHLPREEPVRAMLEKTIERATAAVSEGRDRIQDLRVPADAGRDLGDALAAVGQELARGLEIDFRTLVEGAPRPLGAATRQEAYQIGREALLNAFRHARAASIEVQLIYEEEGLRVRVRDDGVGVNLDAAQSAGHWGMRGMRERAQKLGAQLDVWSREGAGTGTEIALRVPAAAAYVRRAPRSAWQSIRDLLGAQR
ncbi:hypothetical protein DSM104443_03999 [Usitatibacter rugosus]|uniref:Histidine kinase/HSP90-like ATPase domain-containing protein n=1 Tax=Usitatibacter rugosus TaxID=2732067 RepID=A0A6M4H0N4_9PROT|nr:sensor histidine kinase [Usitatibacter rugosus]QJR12905.1 hypothetical protein DSM104443_03999 [Usitatibacter rugosus]